MLDIKIVEEFANTPVPQLIEKYGEDGFFEIMDQMDRDISELKESNRKLRLENDELEKKFVKIHGEKPLVTVVINGTDEGKVGLFIDGKINLFPEVVSVYDSIRVLELIGDMLKIKTDRRLISGVDSVDKSELNDTEWTNVDMKWFFDKILSWIMNDVNPKPKKVYLGNAKFKLCKNGEYKKCWF